MINRREFLKLSAALTAAFGLQGLPAPVAAAPDAASARCDRTQVHRPQPHHTIP